jgi:hypothetical protein
MRRIGFWLAMLTGGLLVASQFACARPTTALSAAGFPHASRIATTEGPRADVPWVQNGKIVRANTWGPSAMNRE